LSCQEPPTAIFASSDYTALGVLSAVDAMGKNVPEDLSLIGFDDMPMSEFLHPPLSTIRQPMREMGIESTKLLLQKITGEEVDSPLIRLKVELIERKSVAKHRSRKTRVRRLESGALMRILPSAPRS
jgi:LacI family transcriptional regulator